MQKLWGVDLTPILGQARVLQMKTGVIIGFNVSMPLSTWHSTTAVQGTSFSGVNDAHLMNDDDAVVSLKLAPAL